LCDVRVEVAAALSEGARAELHRVRDALVAEGMRLSTAQEVGDLLGVLHARPSVEEIVLDLDYSAPGEKREAASSLRRVVDGACSLLLAVRLAEVHVGRQGRGSGCACVRRRRGRARRGVGGAARSVEVNYAETLLGRRGDPVLHRMHV
jgi:hypothetical protein